MLHIKDLLMIEDLYYIGHIADLDGNDWVDLETAQLVLLEYNSGVYDEENNGPDYQTVT